MENLTYKGIVIKEKSLSYETITITSIPSKYLVVEVKAAAVGPYDFYFQEGKLQLCPSRKNVGGYEGSGVVFKVGPDVDQSLVGKRVAFESDYNDENTTGSWGQYAIVNSDRIVLIEDTLSFEKASQLVGNPMTSIALFNSMIRNKHKCIILDTASSALGRMIIRLCLKEGIEMINIVRKDENLKILEEEGSKNNFSQNSSTFYKDIKAKIEELKPSLYITCFGGGMQSTLFGYMGDLSILCPIGNLNGEKLHGFSTADFIFKRKQMVGWHLHKYINSISKEEADIIRSEVQKSVASGDKTFKTEIIGEAPLENFEEAFKNYRLNMSKGKIILKP